VTAARAPGKIVLSGAYSVFEGAPALVASVDRYVLARSDRIADRITDEVARAIEAGVIPGAAWFDASELRSGDRKLGLGSSAAILVASIAAGLPARLESDEALQRAVFAPALAAHRAAQGGGSGVDVAASVHGGVIQCTLADGGALTVARHGLPPGLVIVVFASPVAASTRDLLARVHDLASRDRAAYDHHIQRAATGARAAAAADRTTALISALSEQIDALGALGAAAGAAILTDPVHELRAPAAAEGAAFGPSGAGGGDIAIFVGISPPSPDFLAQARARDLDPLPLLTIGVRGVHLVAE
jgi:phosphomevalonate kinase